MVRPSFLSRLLNRFKDTEDASERFSSRSSVSGRSANLGGSDPEHITKGVGGPASRVTAPQPASESAAKGGGSDKSPAHGNGGGENGGAGSLRLDRVSDEIEKAVPEARKAKTAKMGPQEELSVKINEGMKSLTSLLAHIDEKLAGQRSDQKAIIDRLESLPPVMKGVVEAQRSNLEVLKGIRDSVQEQSRASVDSSKELSKLPGVMSELGDRMDTHAQTSATVRTSVESVGQSVRGLVDSTQRAQNSLLAEFRRAQDAHRQRLEEVVERERKTMIIVSVFGVLVVVCLLTFLMRTAGS